MNWLKTIRAELSAPITIIVFFALFFWPAIFAGRFFVSGDALVYSYPMRSVMWEMIRQGQLPLWTPTLLSGYPLLSMAQLALGYPLTWGYLVLSGHAAEQVYVLAPFLLAPIFTYVYARRIGRSRLASLLAGLTFGFGGLMASRVATYGFLPNSVMWLPLVLTAIERAKSKPFKSSLLWMTLAYAMSVLTGLGQGFLYVGIISVAYAAWLSFVVPPSSENLANERFRLKAGLQTCMPLAVCLGGILLGACLSAFQTLETLQAQRQSIRSKLSYEMFSSGGFTFAEAGQSFLLPFYHYLETETFVVSFAALMALIAIAALFRRDSRDARMLFWLVVAVAGFVLMLGDNTPLYRLLYHIPLLNLFRAPARHAFEWTFALAILAAYGWDRIAVLIRPAGAKNGSLVVGLVLTIATLAIGYGWWRATGKLPIPGAALQHTGLSEQAWLMWKVAFTVAALLSAWWNLRLGHYHGHRWREGLLAFTIAAACFVEPYILMQRWWFGFAKPASYFTQLSAPTKFLQQYKPEENRVYTSLTPGYTFDLPRTEPHNLSARRGLHDASGYEPLMPARYDKAFGNGGQFSSANFSAPLDRQILSPNWQVLDLLNVRFLVEFTAAASGFTEKDDARFSAGDAGMELKAGAKTVLAAPSAKVNTLTIVSALADSGDLNDGEVVAQINFVTAEGQVITRELQAGRDSAEWAHERADVKPTIRHQLAKVFETVSGGDFPIYRFQSRFDVGESLSLDRIEIVNVSKHATLMISKATAYDYTGDGAFLLTQRLPEHWRKVYDYDSVQIYENPKVLPRAWIVPRAQVVTEEEALRAIRGESPQPFNPRELAFVEKPEKIKVGFPQETFTGTVEARIVNYQPNQLAIETRADKRGVLVVSEINHPGWEATIDGQPAAIFQTNYLLRGVILPEGSHRVVMRYTAPAVLWGGIISSLAIFLVGMLILQSVRNKKL